MATVHFQLTLGIVDAEDCSGQKDPVAFAAAASAVAQAFASADWVCVTLVHVLGLLDSHLRIPIILNSLVPELIVPHIHTILGIGPHHQLLVLLLCHTSSLSLT